MALERKVKCVRSELPSSMTLWRDEKSVHFSSPHFLNWEILCQPGLQGNQDSEGILPAAFLWGQATEFTFCLSGEKDHYQAAPGEVGPPVSALLCYEYGTDGAKSICSVGTKTLTTQRSLLKTLLSSFIPSAFCALLRGSDFIEKGTS